MLPTPVQRRRIFRGLRTEGAGAARETAAVALGVFIGCLPLYGLHLLICWTAGFALGLSRLKMYVAANISNPLVAPWLIFAEVQTGSWLRRGLFHPLSREHIASTGIGVFGMDVVVGSLVIGAVLAAAAGAGTYAVVARPRTADPFLDLVSRASDRYLIRSITAWEFARGKLRMDPVYRAVLSTQLLPSGGVLVDIGCGQGLTLALLAEAQRAHTGGHWPVPPRFDRMVGLEIRPRIAAIARDALEDDAEIIVGDARRATLQPARAVLLFDVLHLLRRSEQERLIATLPSRLDPGGVVLVREADAAAGWRFSAVRAGNRFKALALGTWRAQLFCPRTASEWRDCFARHGFDIETRPMGAGTPFANVLFRLTQRPAHPSTGRSGTSAPGAPARGH